MVDAWLIGPRETKMSQTPEEKFQSWSKFLRLFNDDASKPGSFALCDEVGDRYKCLLDKNWHQKPVDIGPSEEAVILVAHADEPTDGPLKAGSHNMAQPIEGILATYRPKAQTHTGNTLARAHRHARLSKASPDQAELWDKLWALAEGIMCYLKNCEDLGANVDRDLIFATAAK